MKILFLFIDGVGLREAASDNPINPEVCPHLCRLIENHCTPIDACLTVPGLPQSATGQATMFTGVNAPVFMGRHCEGFPGPNLRAKIRENNLFMELAKRGKKIKFADAYLVDTIEEIEAYRFKSVTTVMALTEPQSISTIDDLFDDQAILQDITRETIQDRFPDIPTVSPVDAAFHLFSLARAHDFTLFEFFQTDAAGHTQDYARACAVLRLFDKFLASLTRYTQAAGITLVMTADHGNIENMSEHRHTCNPIPFITYGPHEKEIRSGIKSLVDVTPAILKHIFKQES